MSPASKADVPGTLVAGGKVNLHADLAEYAQSPVEIEFDGQTEVALGAGDSSPPAEFILSCLHNRAPPLA